MSESSSSTPETATNKPKHDYHDYQCAACGTKWTAREPVDCPICGRITNGK